MPTLPPFRFDDDLSSLSAILMDDDYYNYTIEHSTLEEGVHIANIESLICRKCRPYLEMTEAENNGVTIGQQTYRQAQERCIPAGCHVLAPADTYEVPRFA
ncbi:hypothetical protein NXW09_29640 [Bacteroides ovatus]|nr:hypothetical protein [Bacteroides ovatus]